MAKSQNGWPVAPPLESFTLNGLTLRCRAGDVRTVLEYVARQFNARVERVITQSSYRTVAGNTGDTGSNHTSATAIDLNGFRHPYEGGRGSLDQGFTPTQIAEVRRILAEVNGTTSISAGVVQWGYDYPRGWRDGMHFQIRPGKTTADVAAAARRIATAVSRPGGSTGGSITTPTIPGRPAPITPENDMTPDQDARLARIEAALSVPGQPYTWLPALNNKLGQVIDEIRGVAADVRAVRGAQQVPGQPFDYAPATHNAIARLIGEVGAIQATVTQLAAGVGDPDAIAAAARQGAADALAGITITIAPGGDPA